MVFISKRLGSLADPCPLRFLLFSLLSTFDLFSAYAPGLFTIFKVYKVFHFWKVRQRAEVLIQIFVICSTRTLSLAAMHLLWVLNCFSWNFCALPVDPPWHCWRKIISSDSSLIGALEKDKNMEGRFMKMVMKSGSCILSLPYSLIFN